MPAQENRNAPNSTIVLIKDVINDVTGLFKDYLELIECTVKENAKRALSVLILLVLAVVTVLNAFIFLGFSMTFVLAEYIPLWLGAFAVVMLSLFVGIIFLILAKNCLYNLVNKDVKYD